MKVSTQLLINFLASAAVFVAGLLNGVTVGYSVLAGIVVFVLFAVLYSWASGDVWSVALNKKTTVVDPDTENPTVTERTDFLTVTVQHHV